MHLLVLTGWCAACGRLPGAVLAAGDPIRVSPTGATVATPYSTYKGTEKGRTGKKREEAMKK